MTDAEFVGCMNPKVRGVDLHTKALPQKTADAVVVKVYEEKRANSFLVE